MVGDACGDQPDQPGVGVGVGVAVTPPAGAVVVPGVMPWSMSVAPSRLSRASEMRRALLRIAGL